MTLALFLTLCGLQCLDAYSTYKVIMRGGREANPVLTWLADHLPGTWTWLIVGKLTVISGAALIAMPNNIVSQVLLGLACAFYGWVVWHNLRQ